MEKIELHVWRVGQNCNFIHGDVDIAAGFRWLYQLPRIALLPSCRLELASELGRTRSRSFVERRDCASYAPSHYRTLSRTSFVYVYVRG